MPSEEDLEMSDVRVYFDAIKIKTDRALLLDLGENDELWIPISQITDREESDLYDCTWIDIPEWLAIEKKVV